MLSTASAFAQDDAKQAGRGASDERRVAGDDGSLSEGFDPGAQHKQLADQFVGTWDTKITAWMDTAR